MLYPPAPDGRGPQPRVRLYVEPLLLNRGTLFAPEEQEESLPVIQLSFDYAGGRHRDPQGEAQVRRVLESFGPTEIACLDSVQAPLGSRADYLVHADPDPHVLCSFSAYVLPQLRAFGWLVEVADDYPFQVVAGDAPLYARLDDGEGDWFSLELGIEVEGRRINLLPTLLELLARLPRSARLDGSAAGLRCLAVPLHDGRFVTLPADRLRILLKVLGELYQPDTEGSDRQRLRFPALAARALGELDASLASDSRAPLRWEGSRKALSLGVALAQGPAAPPAQAALPRGLRADLRPYQRQGVAWLQHLRALGANGVLADDMGLGKTLQVIAHLAVEKEAGRLSPPALVVAPTSLMGNWRRELARFAPGLAVLTLHGPGRHALQRRIAHADVVLTTYAALVRDVSRGNAGGSAAGVPSREVWNPSRVPGQKKPARQSFSWLVLDEAQAIKNARSQAHQAAGKLQARHRLCLSGTPVENSVRELWSLFDFLNPGLLGDSEWFDHRFTRPIEREANAGRLEQLRRQIAPFVLRRTKEEVARELPAKTEIIRPVELRGAQRDLYEGLRLAGHEEVRRAIADRGIGASTVTILGALMKLRQACCDPRLLPGEAARDVPESAKYQLLLELLAQQRAAGRRVLVFSQFATMLALIAEGLRRQGCPFVVLTGATQNRQKPIDDFQSGRCDVFLISLKAGGTGLNLTRADTVIHYDPWWNPAVQAQATDRAHRIGQTQPVFVYNLIVAGSVEERMLALQRRKRALAAGLLGPNQTGSFALGPADVDRLFAPMGR